MAWIAKYNPFKIEFDYSSMPYSYLVYVSKMDPCWEIFMKGFNHRQHMENNDIVSTSNYVQNIALIQSGAAITRSIFIQSPQKITHSSSVRASYGAFFVNMTSDLYFASVVVVP